MSKENTITYGDVLFCKVPGMSLGELVKYATELNYKYIVLNDTLYQVVKEHVAKRVEVYHEVNRGYTIVEEKES